MNSRERPLPGHMFRVSGKLRPIVWLRDPLALEAVCRFEIVEGDVVTLLGAPEQFNSNVRVEVLGRVGWLRSGWLNQFERLT